MAASGRVPRARLPPDRDLRDLRRRRRPRRGSAGSTPRATTSALGIAGIVRRRASSRTSTTRRATKPIHPAWAAHGALLAARLASLGAEGPPGVLEGRFGLYHAFVGAEQGEIDIDGAARRPRLALGDAADRVQAVSRPATSSTARSAPTADAASATLDPDEIEDVVVTVPAAGVSLVLEPAEPKIAPRTRLRGQVLAPVLDRGDARPRPRRRSPTTRDEAIADPARARRSRAKVRYETKEYATVPGRRSPAACAITTARRARRSRPSFPHQHGGPENPLSRRRGAREVPRERALRSPAASVESLEEAILALEEQDDVRAACSRRSPARRRSRRERRRPERSSARSSRPSASGSSARSIPVASELEHADEFPDAARRGR